ncbi:Hypothetical protein FKW44_022446 [Caligus rogercresseyi]|uniref:Uncharacterized protein n=1 Tax=Caligus rogercresseyi TaxID=217165 RepID=A0A7T8JU03_CALRO|nr:Hypothetical protein FKW44_022446 [Caligus rogercresseyi]
MNKPLIRGRKIIKQLPQDSRHQFSGQMRRFSRSRPPKQLKWPGFGLEEGGLPVELRTAFRRQKPPSVMVWTGVTSDGKKAPLIVVEEGGESRPRVYFTFFPRR